MIFLLGRERVLSEMMELMTMRLSQKLEITMDKIHVSLEWDNGKIVTDFKVDTDTAELLPLEKKIMQDAISELWLGKIKPELEFRLKEIDQRRFEICEEVPVDAPEGKKAEDQAEV